MKKFISEGKFKRVCVMPETKLFIATKVEDTYALSTYSNGVRVGGERKIEQTLIARHNSFYYFQYTDWCGDTRHYRQTSLPSYLGFIIGLDLLVQRGGFYQHEQSIESNRLFSVKIELV